MTDITPIITALITLAVSLITCVLVPYIRSKTTAAQREAIAAIIKTGVYAAEQIYEGTGRGADKKKYVLAYLNKLGITYDDDAIDAMIEAAVFALPQAITAETTNA